MKRERIIFILVDGLRTDFLSCYQGRFPTPNIDRIPGLVFENFIVNAPETYSSIGTFFTGLYPHQHRIGYKKIKPHSFLTLLDFVGPQRYSRGMFFPFGNSFEPDYYIRDWGFDPTSIGVSDAHPSIDPVLAWLRERRNNPYFVYLYFWTMRNGLDEMHKIPPHQLVQERSLDVLLSSYAKLIKSLDLQIGRLLDFLDGTFDLLVFTADHGESIRILDGRVKLSTNVKGDIGNAEFLHNGSRFDTAIRVPLIIAGKGLPTGRINAPIAQIDLFPTMVRLIDPLNIFLKLPGRDLTPYLLQDQEPPERPVFICKTSESRSQAIRSMDYKLIFDDSGMMLFDLRNDPEERTNIIDENPSIVEELLKAIPPEADDSFFTKEELILRYTNYADPTLFQFIVKDLKLQDYWDRIAENYEKIGWVSNEEYLARLVKKTVGAKRILDVGCGTGILLGRLSQDGAFTLGIDSSIEMLLRAVRRGNCRFGRIEDLPFLDESFDCIICRMILHHLKDIPAVLKKLFRILSIGGTIIIAERVAPTDELTAEFKSIMDQKEESQVLTSNEWFSLISGAGFSACGLEEIWFRRQSLRNLLEHSCSDRIAEFYIKEKNRLTSPAFQKAANFEFQPENEDIIMDLRHIIITGTKS